MPVLTGWPDGERIVAAVLDDLGTTGGETPLGLREQLPFIRVRRIGGGDNRVTDKPRIEVTVYDVDLDDAKNIAEAARQRLISRPAATAHGVMDRADTETGPHEVPGPDPDRYRVVSATYRVPLRRR